MMLANSFVTNRTCELLNPHRPNWDCLTKSSAGAAALCFDQLWQDGKINRGDVIVLLAFGGGLTWASSAWRI